MFLNYEKYEKMKKIMIISLAMLAANFFTSCEEEKIEPPVNFEFRLLNANGEPSTVFDENEDFIFSFLIINNSKKQLYLEAINDMDDFFEVFDLTSNQENGELISLGKPYNAIHCEFVNGYVIPPLDTLEVKMHWIPIFNNKDTYSKILCDYKYDNTYLPQGSYTTSFSSNFTIANGDNSFTTDNKSFEINFTVE